jgi:hypothetical protein
MWRSFWHRIRGRQEPDRPRVIPDHESPLRAVMASAHGTKYDAVRSLEEARAGDMTVVMEGDSGGTIYLTCPARLVACDESALHELLVELDSHKWKDMEGAAVLYERAPVGSGISGGMGGGIVIDGVWLHPTMEALQLRQHVENVVLGESAP